MIALHAIQLFYRRYRVGHYTHFLKVTSPWLCFESQERSCNTTMRKLLQYLKPFVKPGLTLLAAMLWTTSTLAPALAWYPPVHAPAPNYGYHGHPRYHHGYRPAPSYGYQVTGYRVYHGGYRQQAPRYQRYYRAGWCPSPAYANPGYHHNNHYGYERQGW
jgi:hypothetical protein